MTGRIALDAVTKTYEGVLVVDALSLTIEKGEFFTLLGPSGCGKTTTLRMIAGFEKPDSGAITLDGADLTALPPARRNMNMVFQTYGLFPHMTVAQNVAFGLKIARVPRKQVAERVSAAMRTVRLDGFEQRRPGQLSGGQQQRVALARALVNEPAALLLDEPLGALDLKLRREMQLELKELQQRTGTTFVFVTHDQEEAMAMSDRIAVLNAGVIEQVASPKELYERPASHFVAEFIGTSNLMTLSVSGFDGEVVEDLRGDGQRLLAPRGSAQLGAQLTVTVRPEWIRIGSPVPPHVSVVTGILRDVVYLGSITQFVVDLGTGERLSVHRFNDRMDLADLRPGETVTLWWEAEHSFVIGAPTEAGVSA